MRDPLTDRPHQEISAKLVNAASAIETDDTLTTKQQDQEDAGSLSSEEQHPLGPIRNRYIAEIGDPGTVCP